MVMLGIVTLGVGSSGAHGGSEAANGCEFGVVEYGVVSLWGLCNKC